MFHRNLNVLSVVLLLAGCGGGDFSTGVGLDTGGGGPDGTGGVEADAGAAGATQGTGGATGVTGGQAGVTGGSAGTGGDPGGASGAGTGGQQAGSGGGPGATGGAATGGQQAGTGGASGAGGAGTCEPPVVTPENLPQEVVWESYLTKYGTYCMTCQKSPCTTCPLTWWPVTQSADGLTVTASINYGKCAPAPINVGACTSDLTITSCATWTPSVEATITFQLEPKPDGSGYRVASTIGEQSHVDRVYGSCTGTIQRSTNFDQAWAAYPADQSLLAAAHATMLAAAWPCGQ